MISTADLLAHIESLPVPGKDEKPPPVMASREERQTAAANRGFAAALLNPKNDTERMVKYILQSRMFGGHFRKDGDWATLPNGRRVWQKKVADLYGSIMLHGQQNAAFAYCEIKGVSPGNSFSFSRLDKANNPRQPSQHEKLTEAMNRKQIVWLAIGWWDALPGVSPIREKDKAGRNRTYWRKDELELIVTLVRWSEWLKIYDEHKYRSIRQKDRRLLDHCRIFKGENNRWQLAADHWWREFK